jgi:hypothetical protein
MDGSNLDFESVNQEDQSMDRRNSKGSINDLLINIYGSKEGFI